MAKNEKKKKKNTHQLLIYKCRSIVRRSIDVQCMFCQRLSRPEPAPCKWQQNPAPFYIILLLLLFFFSRLLLMHAALLSKRQ